MFSIFIAKKNLEYAITLKNLKITHQMITHKKFRLDEAATVKLSILVLEYYQFRDRKFVKQS